MALRKKGADAMAIKVIVELQAKPDQRAVLKSLLESVAATLGQGEPGFLGSTRYEVLDNPDILQKRRRQLVGTAGSRRGF
jgi:quinol monooxygenase YgiN